MDVRSGDVDLHLRARYTHCITFKIHYISNAVCHRAYSPFAMHFWKKKLRKCQNVDNQPRVEWWKLNFLFEFVCLWNQNDLFIFCVYIIVVVAIVILSIITKIACIYLCIFIHSCVHGKWQNSIHVDSTIFKNVLQLVFRWKIKRQQFENSCWTGGSAATIKIKDSF